MMLPFLLAFRRWMLRFLLAFGVAFVALLVLKGMGVVSRAAAGDALDRVMPFLSLVGLLWVWTEAAVAGVDPESPYHVAGAPPFRLTVFALVGTMALWSSLKHVEELAGYSGDAWLRQKLAIYQAGVGIGGALMLWEAWRERRTAHPRARWRRWLAACGGALSLLIVVRWEPFVPFTTRPVKPWLYGGLALAALVGLVRGWWPDETGGETPIEQIAGPGQRRRR